MSSGSFPSSRALVLMVNVGRVALGASFLIAPEATIRPLGVDRASAARMSWLVRTAGVRDAALGSGAVVAILRERSPTPWVLAGAACDAVDALVTAQAAQQRRVDPFRGRLVAVGAGATAVLCATLTAAEFINLRTTRRAAAVPRARRRLGRR